MGKTFFWWKYFILKCPNFYPKYTTKDYFAESSHFTQMIILICRNFSAYRLINYAIFFFHSIVKINYFDLTLHEKYILKHSEKAIYSKKTAIGLNWLIKWIKYICTYLGSLFRIHVVVFLIWFGWCFISTQYLSESYRYIEYI